MPPEKAVEHVVRNEWLARFARALLWETPESQRSFVEILGPCIVSKMEPELSQAQRKGRLDNLGKRAFRWLEKSFWDDVCLHPDDPLDRRTLRLKKLFDATPKIPVRQGDSEHYPISVFIEYTSLEERLKPVFTRRPPTIRHLPKGGAEPKSLPRYERAALSASA